MFKYFIIASLTITQIIMMIKELFPQKPKTYDDILYLGLDTIIKASDYHIRLISTRPGDVKTIDVYIDESWDKSTKKQKVDSVKIIDESLRELLRLSNKIYENQKDQVRIYFYNHKDEVVARKSINGEYMYN